MNIFLQISWITPCSTLLIIHLSIICAQFFDLIFITLNLMTTFKIAPCHLHRCFELTLLIMLVQNYHIFLLFVLLFLSINLFNQEFIVLKI
jgi:hypothetical protein